MMVADEAEVVVKTIPEVVVEAEVKVEVVAKVEADQTSADVASTVGRMAIVPTLA